MNGPNNTLGKHVLTAMRRHDEEIGKKLALSIAEYDRIRIAPMEEVLTARILWLETPWYRRLMFRVKHAWRKKTTA